jgi:hypothetical protein
MIRRRILLAACLPLGAPLPTAGHPCRPQTRRRGMELQLGWQCHLLRPGLAGRRCPRNDQRAPPNRTAQRAPCAASLFRVNSWPLALAYCSPLDRRPKHGEARIFRSPNITISNNQPRPLLRSSDRHNQPSVLRGLSSSATAGTNREAARSRGRARTWAAARRPQTKY